MSLDHKDHPAERQTHSIFLPHALDVRLQYRARAKTRATPLRLSTPSMFFQAPTNTIASVASPLGACRMAYTFSPAWCSPDVVYAYFCRATFKPDALKISPSFSLTLNQSVHQYALLPRYHDLTPRCSCPPWPQPHACTRETRSGRYRQSMYGPALARVHSRRCKFVESSR